MVIKILNCKNQCCEMLYFGLLSIGNILVTNTTRFHREQFKSMALHWLLLKGVCHNVLSGHGMRDFGLEHYCLDTAWASLDLLCSSQTVWCWNNTIFISLSQHWIASSTNYSIYTHKYRCTAFMIFSDSTGPLTLPLSGYPNPEQSSEA